MKKKLIYGIGLFLIGLVSACSAPKNIEIKGGSEVTLTFINEATMAGMNHNVIILKPNTNVKKFASDALSYGPSYVPPSQDIVAQTKMTNPGETTQITFTLPNKKGYYPFVCTFPGHATSMKGTIRVL